MFGTQLRAKKLDEEATNLNDISKKKLTDLLNSKKS